MTTITLKHDFPVSDVRRYLEPGPIVLVSSRWNDQTNIMTMGCRRQESHQPPVAVPARHAVTG